VGSRPAARAPAWTHVSVPHAFRSFEEEDDAVGQGAGQSAGARTEGGDEERHALLRGPAQAEAMHAECFTGEVDAPAVKQVANDGQVLLKPYCGSVERLAEPALVDHARGEAQA
jgi:hypothetical protein